MSESVSADNHSHAFEIARAAAQGAAAARQRSRLGGQAKFMTTNLRRSSEWDRIRWASFTRVASVLIPPYDIAGVEPLTDGILQGLRQSVQAEQRASRTPAAEYAAALVEDCLYGAGTFPMKASGERMSHLTTVLEHLTTAKPVFTKVAAVQAFERLRFDRPTDEPVVVPRSLAFFFDHSAATSPRVEAIDPAWQGLHAAATIVLRRLPVVNAMDELGERDVADVVPHLVGFIVGADEGGNIGDDVTFLVEPHGKVIRDGEVQEHLLFPATCYPILSEWRGTALELTVNSVASAAAKALAQNPAQIASNKPFSLSGGLSAAD